MTQVFEFQRKQAFDEELDNEQYVSSDVEEQPPFNFKEFEKNETESYNTFISEYERERINQYIFTINNRRKKLIARNMQAVSYAIEDFTMPILYSTDDENKKPVDNEPKVHKQWGVIKTPVVSEPVVFHPPTTETQQPKHVKQHRQSNSQPQKRHSMLRNHLQNTQPTQSATQHQTQQKPLLKQPVQETHESDVTDEEMVAAMNKKRSPRTKETSHSSPSKPQAHTHAQPQTNSYQQTQASQPHFHKTNRTDTTSSVNQRPQYSNAKTRMCFRMENCNRKDTCTFAHNFEEYSPIECKFQNCRKDGCTYFHKTKETKQQYIKRVNTN